jgi:alpha-tubulin suppressor-like RCC1 family protein
MVGCHILPPIHSNRYPSSAATPCIVEDLSDLPTGSIVKISSGGYVTAALTSGNDLYVWGGRAGQPKLLDDLSGTPMPVDLDGEDVLDMSVGMDHMIALSTERRLYVVGSGDNGQLGVDEIQRNGWREVSLPLKPGMKIVSVYAGYKNSFLVVEDSNK